MTSLSSSGTAKTTFRICKCSECAENVHVIISGLVTLTKDKSGYDFLIVHTMYVYIYMHVCTLPVSMSHLVGRESSHGMKELLNLPPLVLKARHLSGSVFCGD